GPLADPAGEPHQSTADGPALSPAVLVIVLSGLREDTSWRLASLQYVAERGLAVPVEAAVPTYGRTNWLAMFTGAEPDAGTISPLPDANAGTSSPLPDANAESSHPAAGGDAQLPDASGDAQLPDTTSGLPLPSAVGRSPLPDTATVPG